MSSSGKPFTTVTLEDGSCAVVRADPCRPRLLEVIAIFIDPSRGRSYAEMENNRSAEQSPINSIEGSAEALQRSNDAIAELSPRQSAVLKALRTKMDAHNRVEAKAAALAGAAQIPLGSLHSILQSLEKKQLIKTERGGSARAPTVYQVL
jgi:DNA-binding MarR family transcriptional regulator